jgi:hypothetical protein
MTKMPETVVRVAPCATKPDVEGRRETEGEEAGSMGEMSGWDCRGFDRREKQGRLVAKYVCIDEESKYSEQMKAEMFAKHTSKNEPCSHVR